MRALNKATELSSTWRILFWFGNRFHVAHFYIRNYYPYAFTQLLCTIWSTSSWWLTSRMRVILRSWQFLSWSRNFPHFEENAGSLLYLIQPATYSYPEPNMSTVCTLLYFFFKTVGKHWWIQVDWKHRIKLFFPQFRKWVCSRAQWPDLSPLPTFFWHITYFLSHEVIFLKYLRILRLVTHRKIGWQILVTEHCKIAIG